MYSMPMLLTHCMAANTCVSRPLMVVSAYRPIYTRIQCKEFRQIRFFTQVSKKNNIFAIFSIEITVPKLDLFLILFIILKIKNPKFKLIIARH